METIFLHSFFIHIKDVMALKKGYLYMYTFIYKIYIYIYNIASNVDESE